MADKTYNAEEIRGLLQRAAQLQADLDASPEEGLSLSELEEIATESGIDPKYLRAAIREAEAGGTVSIVAGRAASRIFVERSIPGSLSESGWEDAVQLLRDRWGSSSNLRIGPEYGPGITEVLGRTLTWHHTTRLGIKTTATLRKTDGAVRLRIDRKVGMGTPTFDGAAIGAFVSLITATLVAGPASLPAWVFLLILIFTFAIAAPLVGRLDQVWRTKKLKELDEVADALAKLVVVPTDTETNDRTATAESSRRFDENVAAATPKLEIPEAAETDDEVRLRPQKRTR